MIEKLTPDQLKAAFDLSDVSDVAEADRRVVAKTFGGVSTASSIVRIVRLLKHYHPELFVDPHLEAAKKIARQLLAEEYAKAGLIAMSHQFSGGIHDDIAATKATIRALLMGPPSGEAQDA